MSHTLDAWRGRRIKQRPEVVVLLLYASDGPKDAIDQCKGVSAKFFKSLSYLLSVCFEVR